MVYILVLVVFNFMETRVSAQVEQGQDSTLPSPGACRSLATGAFALVYSTEAGRTVTLDRPTKEEQNVG